MKKIFITSLLFSSLFLHTPAYAENNIHILFNGNSQTYDQMPVIQNSRTYIPLRGVSESFGAHVLWNDSTRVITVQKDTLSISFGIGSTQATVNNVKKDIPDSFILNGRTMIPIRFISENLGLQVFWNEKTQTVEIIDPSTTALIDIPSLPTTLADGIINSARFYLGTPYLYGGTYEKDKKFDCSSFVQKVFSENGISLPRVAEDQATLGKEVTLSNAQKGDLLFFDLDKDAIIDHVGILIDNQTMINASSSLGVSYSSLKPYWFDKIVAVKRIFK